MHTFQLRRGGPFGAAANPGAVAASCGPRGGRHGIASVLAMMYLVIFASLALGFYATVAIAAQLAGNEQRGSSAQLAAESGLQFLRYQMSRLDVPRNLSPDDQFKQVCTQLAANLNGTGNVGSAGVAYDGNTLTFPAAGVVRLDRSGTRGFRVTLTRNGPELVSRVVGCDETARYFRGIEVTFAQLPNTTTIFNFGVASRGPIQTSGSATIKGANDPARGSIITTTKSSPAVSINGKAVSGDICMTSKTSGVYLGSGVSVGGTTNTALIYKDHVHNGVPDPRFPDIDTSVYAKYATNTYVAGMNALDNCRVPAGVSCNLTGGAVIRGVLYLEKGASLHCSGGVTVQGVIVSSNDATVDLSTNVIDFGGQVNALSIKDLPESFGEVRNLTGAFIIAPTYRVRIWGNVGTITGTIFCGQFQMGGSAEGTIVGTVIQMLDVPTTISGSADVFIAGIADVQIPVGVTFGYYYGTRQNTYLEVRP